MDNNMEKARELIDTFNISKAIPLLNAEIKETGDPEAYMYLGEFHYLKLCEDNNPKLAYAYTLKAAEAKNARAMKNLGLMYREGFVVSKDLTKAFECFNNAFNNGCKDAGIFLAQALEDGQGCVADVQKAVKLYEDITSGRGMSPIKNVAIQRLAVIYEHGKGNVPQDLNKAAYNYYGNYISNHIKYAENHEKYIDLAYQSNNKENLLLVARAQMGNRLPSGYVLFGILYLKGYLVKQKPKKAFKFFLKGYKETKNPECAYHLGKCYFGGIGTIRDIKAAKNYLEIASEAGIESAKKIIEEYSL